MMSGVVGNDTTGAASAYSASMFYVLTYVLTTLGSFGVILLLSKKGLDVENISDLNGLNSRAPWMALVMLVLMFSLAGVPPMVGFYAKLAVLQAVFAAGHVWLTVYAVMMSLIGAFYYLRVVKALYFEAPADANAPVVGARPSALLGMNGAAIVVLGILPSPLMALCLTAMQRILGS
jgi:NADH-quinone oxidoreductase subunit N